MLKRGQLHSFEFSSQKKAYQTGTLHFLLGKEIKHITQCREGRAVVVRLREGSTLPPTCCYRPSPYLAGASGLGIIPSGGMLGNLGLASSSSTTYNPTTSMSTGGSTIPAWSSTTAATLTSVFSGGSLSASGTSSLGAGGNPKASDTIVVAPGVPALKRSLVEVILAGKFVDLGELPPAKGFGRTQAALSSDMEGKIVLLQAADYVQSKKQIPDLATWIQCFAIYSAVLLTKYPGRAQSLFLYSATISRLSKKFRWPSWIIYDQQFRQEAADTGLSDWAKIDSSIYTQCFTAMSLNRGGWCSICTSMDHVKETCPYQSAEDRLGQKRQGTSPNVPHKKARGQFKPDETCRKWNRLHYMKCPHGESCIFAHACSVCRATDHGALKCPKARSQGKSL